VGSSAAATLKMRDSLHRQGIGEQRWVALIGIAVILFQALLFGWHHHAVALPGHDGPIASLHGTSQPLLPASAEGVCEICAVLHHHSTASLAFSLLPEPCCAGLADHRPDTAAIGLADTRVFRARAPPPIESTT